MKNTILNQVLLLGILLLFYSCNNQNDTSRHLSKKPNTLGRNVTNLNVTIWSIYQDKKSHFWFGSKDNGVYHYDGKHLRHFSKEDGLVSNDIRGIQEDAIGNIFFETTTGISKYNGYSFQTLEIREGTSADWKLKSNDLWFNIGYKSIGPYRYDGKHLYSLKFPTSPQESNFYKEHPTASFSPYSTYTIYKDQNGILWFGTSSLGLCRFDGMSINWYYDEQLQKTPSGGDFGMRSIVQDHEGLFWFNNSQYRYKVLPSKTEENNLLNLKKENGAGHILPDSTLDYPYFLSIAQDDHHNLWMVTYEDGVYKNNGKELFHYPIIDEKKQVLLFSIFKDKQGVIWLGTHNDGVYKFNGKSFEKFKL